MRSRSCRHNNETTAFTLYPPSSFHIHPPINQAPHPVLPYQAHCRSSTTSLHFFARSDCATGQRRLRLSSPGVMAGAPGLSHLLIFERACATFSSPRSAHLPTSSSGRGWCSTSPRPARLVTGPCCSTSSSSTRATRRRCCSQLAMTAAWVLSATPRPRAGSRMARIGSMIRASPQCE